MERIGNELCVILPDERAYSIVEEGRGVREKFWLKRVSTKFVKYDEKLKNISMLFKFNRNLKSCEDWGEICASLIARKVGLPCVEYHSAKLIGEDGSDMGNGVLCGNYKHNDREVEYSGFSLQSAHKNFQYDNCRGKKIDGLNTVEGFVEALKVVFRGQLSDNEITEVRNELIKQAIFDFLLAQTDRHWLNTTFLLFEHGGSLHVRKSDAYDNGCIALLKRKAAAIDGMSKEIGKLGKDSPYLRQQLSNYCPMFGLKTSNVVIDDRVRGGDIERVKVFDPQHGREAFLQEMAEEILYNPEIAVFFKNIEIKMRESTLMKSVVRDLEASGENPPPYVIKMINDVMGHQFDILNERVQTRLAEINGVCRKEEM